MLPLFLIVYLASTRMATFYDKIPHKELMLLLYEKEICLQGCFAWKYLVFGLNLSFLIVNAYKWNSFVLFLKAWDYVQTFTNLKTL